MKKLFLTTVVLLILICMLSACGTTTPPDIGGTTVKTDTPVDESNGSNNPPDNKNKFSGTVSKGTPFSEGLAIVTDGEKTYCIDKTASIVFTLDIPFLPNSGGLYTKGYQNGLVMIGENLYDKSGKATSPADVGATKFYDYALSGGYIIAYKEESTYNSTARSIGILDSTFNWVIPLNEELYKNAPRLTTASMYAYAIEGYIIDSNAGFVFEIASSTYYDFEEAPESLGEYGWSSYTDGSFRKGESTVMFTVENGRGRGNWVDGKHTVSFYNKTADKYYFTLVDTTGAFAFEPVELQMPRSNWGYNWVYDGRYITVSDAVNDSSVYIYDTVNQTAHISNGTIFGDIVFSDGVIAAYQIQTSAYSGTKTKVRYYDLNFNPLF